MSAGYSAVTVAVNGSATIPSMQYDDGSGNKIQGVLIRDVAGNNYFSSALPGYVQFESAQPVTVSSGTVVATAAAGASLALEAGGNLAATATAVEALAALISSGKLPVTATGTGGVSLALESGGNLAATATAAEALAALIHSGALYVNLNSQTNTVLTEVTDTSGNTLFTSTHPGYIQGAQALGTPGTVALTVQGSPSGTPIPVSTSNSDPTATTGNITVQDSGSTTTANSAGQNIVTGTATTGSFVSATITACSTARIQLSTAGGFTGSATIVVDKEIASGIWQNVSFRLPGASSNVSVASQVVNTASTSFEIVADVGALTTIRARAIALSGGASVAVVIQPGYGISDVSVPGIVQITGIGTNPSATFNRPANTTAYAVGALVANATSSPTAMQFTVQRANGLSSAILRARLTKSGTSNTNAQFRLHLFTANPTVASGGDGTAWATALDGSATHIGYLDCVSMYQFADGCQGNGSPDSGQAILSALASGTVLYGYTEARGAYTPASGETFTWTLEVLEN